MRHYVMNKVRVQEMIIKTLNEQSNPEGASTGNDHATAIGVSSHP